MKEKKRLDMLIFEMGLVPSRERAKSVIMAGNVYVDNQKVDKAGTMVTSESNIEVRGKQLEFVSRGGLKLDKAMKSFGLTMHNKTTMDIGASTGGFTDCMLRNGAVKVYAVDVGYGQLAWKLRTDDRVVNLERTNIRYVTEEQIGQPIDFISVDVSFISLSLVIPVVKKLLASDGEAVCLIKPQFEAGREKVGKKGVVKDSTVHLEVIEKIINLVIENSLDVCGLDFSPVKGPEGNIEYLIYIKNSYEAKNYLTVTPKEIVDNSHNALSNGE